MPGVGKVLPSTLLAHLPEPGMLNRKQIAALADGRNLTAIVENCTAAVVSVADARKSGTCYLWRRREFAAIRHQNFLSGTCPAVNTPSPRSWSGFASFSLFSMPCFTNKHPRSRPRSLPFLPAWARILNTVAARTVCTTFPNQYVLLHPRCRALRRNFADPSRRWNSDGIGSLRRQ